MPIKNHLDTSTTQQNILSTPKLKHIGLTLAFLTSVLCITPSFWQNKKNQEKEKKEDIHIIGKDTIDYESIKTFAIEGIDIFYSNETILKIIQEYIFLETNRIREKEWLSLLSINNELMTAAQLHAEEMVKTKNFSHWWKWSSTPSSRAKKAWYQWKNVTENIGCNFYSLEKAIQSWRNSSAHFNNMIDPNHKYIWIGKSGTYWVVLFGN